MKQVVGYLADNALAVVAPASVRTSVSAAAVDGLRTGLASSCPDQRLVSLSRVVIVGSRGE
jgi:hypothetical protein